MNVWLPILTALLGGVGGYVLHFFLSPKSERDRLALDAERLKLERTQHSRSRRIRLLEALSDE